MANTSVSFGREVNGVQYAVNIIPERECCSVLVEGTIFEIWKFEGELTEMTLVFSLRERGRHGAGQGNKITWKVPLHVE